MSHQELLTEIAQFQHAHPDVAYVDLLAMDIPGHLYGKRYPLAALAKTVTSGELKFPQNCILLGNRGGVYPIKHYVYGDGDPDMPRHLVPGTLKMVPWETTPIAQMLFTSSGTVMPVSFEPREVLQRVLHRFSALGYKVVVAFELEFYLAQTQLKDGALQFPVDPVIGEPDDFSCMDLERVSRFAAVLHDITEAAQTQGISTTVISPELGPGQYEINFRHHEDAMIAADWSALFVRCVRGVARRHNLRATFMSKPYLDHPGSGLHVHVSVYDAQGNNVLAANDNALLRSAAAGCIALAPASMPIFANNMNAMRRYGSGQGNSASNASWGFESRAASIRIPTSDDKNRRLEHRLAGADANPYLVLAAILAGIEHGMENKLVPPPSVNDDRDSGVTIATDLLAAVDALDHSAVLREKLGHEFIDVYAANRRQDHAAFMQHISEREYRWYW